MSKKSIEQQVAELTFEQRNNMGKIYKRYIASIVSLAVVGLLISVILFVYFAVVEKEAREEYDYISFQIELNQTENVYDLELFDERMEALDRQYDAQMMKFTSLAIGASVTFVGILLVYFVFKSKYPYFSEKKYSYLKKMQNNKPVMQYPMQPPSNNYRPY